MFLGKGVFKKCSQFTEEHPCRSAISIKLQITLRHGCSPVNALHIFRTVFPKNTSGGLLLEGKTQISKSYISHSVNSGTKEEEVEYLILIHSIQ